MHPAGTSTAITIVGTVFVAMAGTITMTKDGVTETGITTVAGTIVEVARSLTTRGGTRAGTGGLPARFCYCAATASKRTRAISSGGMQQYAAHSPEHGCASKCREICSLFCRLNLSRVQAVLKDRRKTS